nr:retrovirus-related Pol polyprotein from transposon TNT 1-94 [Tanacetum cinerariifolium]
DKNIAISDLKKLIEQGKAKSVDTKFDRPSVIRQPNAQRIPKPSVFGKPTPFSNSLDRIYFQKTRSVSKANVSEGLSKPVTAQTLPQTAKKAISNTNVLTPGLYRIDNRIAHTRAPQLPQTVRNTNPRIVQLILFIVDSGCTKHMTGNLKLLCNFIKKYMGTVRFGNDQFALILGYGDLVQGNVTINKDIVIGLPKLKYVKDQLCSSCELSKAKRSSFKSKVVPSLKGRLNLLHMDLCGPTRVASINGKKYILVIIDDYSRYTWTLFQHSKDETPEVLKDFLTMIQRNLQAPMITVRTDGGTEFLNKTLNAFFKEEGIEHQTSTARTPEQNDVVERRNHTLVEAARTMLSASQLLLSFGLKQLQLHAILKTDP